MRYYRQYHPRENQLYVEVDDEYLRRVDFLEAEIRDYLFSCAGKVGKYELE